MEERPSTPPLTHILPPTITARAPLNGLGREARGVQSDAPRTRAITEEVKEELDVRPPATMIALKCDIIGGRGLTLVEGRAAQAWFHLVSGS